MNLTDLSQTAGKVETLSHTVPYIHDPLSAFEQLCTGKPYTLLLESAEIDSKDELKSLILTEAALKVVCQGQRVTCTALTQNGNALIDFLKCECAHHICPPSEDVSELNLAFDRATLDMDEESRLKAPSVFDVLRKLVHGITPLRTHPHAVFVAGIFAYDLLAGFEHIPPVPERDNTCPDYIFYVAETLLLVNHEQKSTEIIGSVFSGKDVANSYFSISQKIEEMSQKLGQPFEPIKHPKEVVSPEHLQVSQTDEDFIKTVMTLKKNILAGDVLQVVPSRTFSLPCPSPYLAYRQLKRQNPSPYMFYVQDEDFSVFGASPESALKYSQKNNQVEVHPIAGTRPRGRRADGTLDPDLDNRIELDLREDAKEKAEHLMLVDLARNDIARVAHPGTRAVKDLLKVDRYSHVMHLVSRVTGQLRSDLDALHAYQACMNMGTLVGAPKVKAADLIHHIEQQRRGSYGGAVGYINSTGDMDTCIVIRSAFIRHQTAYIQAGAGIVYDSDPQSEADETRNKAHAVISAILNAHTIKEGPNQ